jgi:hypothetical protein
MTTDVKDFSRRTTAQAYHFRHSGPPPKERFDRIKAELQQRGAVTYNMWLPETRYLAFLIHEDEHIMGSVYGRYKSGRGALIATDQRVIFIDKKPLFLHCDELTFAIIGGVTYSRTALFGFVTLHTRLGDFGVRTLNHKNAANFVDYIETQCLQQNIRPTGGLYNSMLM